MKIPPRGPTPPTGQQLDPGSGRKPTGIARTPGDHGLVAKPRSHPVPDPGKGPGGSEGTGIVSAPRAKGLPSAVFESARGEMPSLWGKQIVRNNLTDNMLLDNRSRVGGGPRKGLANAIQDPAQRVAVEAAEFENAAMREARGERGALQNQLRDAIENWFQHRDSGGEAGLASNPRDDATSRISAAGAAAEPVDQQPAVEHRPPPIIQGSIIRTPFTLPIGTGGLTAPPKSFKG